MVYSFPVQTIVLAQEKDLPAAARRAAEAIVSGGLICLPYAGAYRLVADFTNTDSVISLMQSKRRVRPAPALVFIANEAQIAEVAEHVDPLALRVARALWPQPLTVRLQPRGDLPNALRKQLGGKKARVGVRVPAEDLMRGVIDAAGRPLIVSSANRQTKTGDTSPAQVRKNFANIVEMFFDDGDLEHGPTSTVIDVVDGEIVIERAGAIPVETVRAAAARAP